MSFPLPETCSGFLYEVMPGDTMYDIAKKFGVDLRTLIRSNPQVDDPDVIYPGQIICIPEQSEAVREYHMSSSPSPRIVLPNHGPINVTRPDNRLLPMLFDLFAGPKSELTLTLQEHNHHMHYMVFEPKEVGPYLEAIGDTDMHHMHELGQIILKMGYEIPYEYPCDSGWKYWSSDHVYVGTGLRDRLQSDIEIKRAGVDAYNKILAMNPEQSIRDVIIHIRDEELLHIDVLNKLIRKYA